MLGVPQWFRCLAGAVVVLVFTAGQAAGTAQMLAAARVEVSLTVVPLLWMGSMLLIGTSLLVLAASTRMAR